MNQMSNTDPQHLFRFSLFATLRFGFLPGWTRSFPSPFEEDSRETLLDTMRTSFSEGQVGNCGYHWGFIWYNLILKASTFEILSMTVMVAISFVQSFPAARCSAQHCDKAWWPVWPHPWPNGRDLLCEEKRIWSPPCPGHLTLKYVYSMKICWYASQLVNPLIWKILKIGPYQFSI
jgi:hypothetical protein